MWSLQMLGLERTLRGHARCLHALAVSGLLLISSSSDKTVLIWCAETWVCLQSRCRRRGRMMAAYPAAALGLGPGPPRAPAAAAGVGRPGAD